MLLPAAKETFSIPMLPSHLVESIAQSAVNQILDPHSIERRVLARGNQFCTFDRFTLLMLFMKTLDWYAKNGDVDLTEEVFRGLVETVNKTSMRDILSEAEGLCYNDAHILVPEIWETPPFFFRTVIQAGGIHEAWHTLYTERKDLPVDKTVARYFPKLPKRVFVSPISMGFLKTLWNVLEDAMIERCGIEKDPSMRPLMCTILDHILEEESFGRLRKNITSSSAFIGTLRDLARGYNIQRCRTALAERKRSFPKVVDMFKTTPGEEGAMADFIKRARVLKSSWEVVDLFLDIWEVLRESAASSSGQKSQEGQQGQQGQQGQSGKGSQGADGGESQEGGGSSSGKQQKGKSKGSKNSKGGRGRHQENTSSQSGGGAGGSRSEQEGDQNSKDSSAGGSSQGEGLEDELNQAAGAEGGEGEGEDGPPLDQDMSAEDLSRDILESPKEWMSYTIQDLVEKIAEEIQKNRPPYELQKGEARWNPSSVTDDKIVVVPAGNKDATANRIEAIRQVVGALRAQLRVLFISQRVPGRVDGLPKGKTISSRFLAETAAMLRAKEIPTRAFRQNFPVQKQDVAIALCTDESGSMYSVRELLLQAFVAIAESMSVLGQSLFAFGIRDGSSRQRSPDREGSHRSHPVEYAIYQKWRDPFPVVLSRFDSMKPDGSTPLGDGVHFGVEILRPRPETFRLLFVLTDGEPNHGHAPVIRHECRLAKQAGIRVIGVGIGTDTPSIPKLFDDHVLIPDIRDLPTKLMGKLYEICRGLVST